MSSGSSEELNGVSEFVMLDKNEKSANMTSSPLSSSSVPSPGFDLLGKSS